MKTRLIILTAILATGFGCEKSSDYDRADRSTWPSQAMDFPDEELVRRALDAHKDEQLAKLDTTGATIDLDRLFMPNHLSFTSIPALTDPRRVPVADAMFPPDESGRLIVVVIEGRVVAYPIGILNWHEVVNDTVAGVPIAVVFCPLCDAVSVLDRRIETVNEQGDTYATVLEFGVSGMLDNSNVVMLERTTMALWSQVGLEALTGPHAGRTLKHLAFSMMDFGGFKALHPEGKVLSLETGFERPYDEDPFALYMLSDTLRMEMMFGDALPPKTLGAGVRAGTASWFVSAETLMTQPRTLMTPLGPVELAAGDSGIQVIAKPPGVQVLQSFYLAWSAFFPDTDVISD